MLSIANASVWKAFDRVKHRVLFRALDFLNMSERLISLIKLFYSKQIGRGDKSEVFAIEHGVKQGYIHVYDH